MQAILLCAGKSTRTLPLTATKPKPLLPILDTTIIDYTLNILKEHFSKIIIVVGYKKEMIQKHLENKYPDLSITYVEQKEQKGTGHAVLECIPYITEEKIVIMNGDDLYSKEDIKTLINQKHGALTKKVDNPSQYGVFIEKNNCVVDLIEKPDTFVGNNANIGCYFVKKEFCEDVKKIKPSKRGELEITDAIKEYALKNKDFKTVPIQKKWFPIGYPWNYLEANVQLLKQKKTDIHKKVVIEENVIIQGNAIIGEGTIIKAGTYIEGPVYIGKNCIIGPHAYIRKDTIIMDECNIRGEIVDSVIMPSTKAKHHCYIGHSVLGEKCNIAAGTITADYRHDAKEHETMINDKKVNSKRKKLGGFLGDNVKTGVGTLIYPGRKIWPNKTTNPGEIVKKDKM